MENRPSTLRMEYEVAGNTINKGKNEPLEFGFNYKGQQESIWINYQDMVAHHQCEEMFARMLMYGKKNWTADHKYLNKDDKTKYAIESGAGFFEQIAPSNVHYYNSYDLDWHLEMLLDMGVGKIERGKRVIHLLTGEFGAIEISKQIQAKTGTGKFTFLPELGGTYLNFDIVSDKSEKYFKWGYYTPKTTSAVSEFQKEKNLSVDGVIGGETMKKLLLVLKNKNADTLLKELSGWGIDFSDTVKTVVIEKEPTKEEIETAYEKQRKQEP
jgi:hypothetical protein